MLPPHRSPSPVSPCIANSLDAITFSPVHCLSYLSSAKEWRAQRVMSSPRYRDFRRALLIDVDHFSKSRLYTARGSLWLIKIMRCRYDAMSARVTRILTPRIVRMACKFKCGLFFMPYHRHCVAAKAGHAEHSLPFMQKAPHTASALKLLRLADAPSLDCLMSHISRQNTDIHERISRLPRQRYCAFPSKLFQPHLIIWLIGNAPEHQRFAFLSLAALSSKLTFCYTAAVSADVYSDAAGISIARAASSISRAHGRKR